MEAAQSEEALEAAKVAKLEEDRKKAVAEAKAKERASMIHANDAWVSGFWPDDVPIDIPKRESGMDTEFLRTLSMYSSFFESFIRRDDNWARRKLRRIKDKLAGFRSLPPHFEESSSSRRCERDLARETYEAAVVMSVLNVDCDGFESDFSLLRPFYTDKRVCSTRISVREYALVRLNLLRLLVQNRIADFHAELVSLAAAAVTEQCPPPDATEHFPRHRPPYFMKKVKPEYDRVFTERQVLNFVLPLKDGLKISHGMKAVRRLRMKEMVLSLSEHKRMKARRMKAMMLSLLKQNLSGYMKNAHPEWEMKNGCVVFSERGAEEETSKHCNKLMMQLINETLEYARDLKQIDDDDEPRKRFITTSF